ncbi:MAG TPA: lytic transglycosylase domain-containing protein [Acidiferrobacterales bacterium]
MTLMQGRSKIWQVLLGVSVLCWTHGDALAAFYVYQLPGGTRIITDHPIANKDYKLVRKSESARGVGAMVSEKRVQSAAIDVNAYDRLIRRAATRHRVDIALVKAVMHAESAFNPNAISDKGASGLMQLMPATAARYGVEDIFDPVQNVHGGVRYLRDLLVMFDHNPRLAVAAYNAGENAVKRHRGIPPYAETRGYVRKVLALKQTYTPKTAARAAAPKAVARNSATVVPVADVQKAAPAAPSNL